MEYNRIKYVHKCCINTIVAKWLLSFVSSINLSPSSPFRSGWVYFIVIRTKKYRKSAACVDCAIKEISPADVSMIIIKQRTLTFGIDVEWQVDDLNQGDGVEDKEQDTARQERD